MSNEFYKIRLKGTNSFHRGGHGAVYDENAGHVWPSIAAVRFHVERVGPRQAAYMMAEAEIVKFTIVESETISLQDLIMTRPEV